MCIKSGCIFPVSTATVGTVVIASESVSLSESSLSGSTMEYNVTGDFVQSGVTITVSVEAVMDSQVFSPVCSTYTIPGGQCRLKITSRMQKYTSTMQKITSKMQKITSTMQKITSRMQKDY